MSIFKTDLSIRKRSYLAKLKIAVPVLALLLVGAVVGYLLSCAQGREVGSGLPAGIKETYVAVVPFKNNTGKPEMEVVGEMAADWITSGLHETGEGKILSVGEVNDIIKSVQRQQTSLDNSISEKSAVHYLIEGAYYEVDSSLLFSSNVKDLRTGEIVFSFPILEGKVDDPMASIELLKQRILGYWVTKDRAGYERHPPVYEAYQAYLEGGKIWYDNPDKAMALMKRAADLDSNFHYATFGYIHKLLNNRMNAEADSMIAAFQNRKEQLSRMELEFLAGLQARITKNHDLQWKHWNSPFMEAYWGKNFVLKQKAGLLLGYYYQPEYALELLREVDFSSLDYKEDPLARMLYLRKTEALSLVGRNQEATQMWMNLPFENHDGHTIFRKIFGLAQLKAYPELEQEIERYSNAGTALLYPAHYLRGLAVLGILGIGDFDKAQRDGRVYLKFLEEENQDTRPSPGGHPLQEIQCILYLALGEPVKATPLIELGVGLDESQADVLALKGIYYAQMKNESAARKVIQQLEGQGGKYDYGNAEMNKATIEAWLGNHDTAISLLMEARQKGWSIWYYFFDGAWRLQPLYEHPDFAKKVLAPIPLPRLENPTASPPTAANHYWLFIVLLICSGFGYYFFWRKSEPTEQPTPDHPSSEVTQPTAEAEDVFLQKLHEVIAAYMGDADFGLPQLCKKMGVSRAQVYRKIKDLTGQSPAVYIRNMKLQKAKELLQNTDLNVSEVAYEVGFKDLSYFSRSFSEEFGISPSETRK